MNAECWRCFRAVAQTRKALDMCILGQRLKLKEHPYDE